MNYQQWQPPYNTLPFYTVEPKKIEKGNLKRTFSTACMSMIWFLVFQFVVSFFLEIPMIVIMLANVTNIESFNDFNILDSSTLVYLLIGIVYIVSLFIPFIIMCKQNKLKIDDVLNFKKVGIKNNISILLFSFAFAMMAQLIIISLNINLDLLGFNNNVNIVSESTGILDYILMFVTTAILPAFLEEMLFRGVMLTSFRKFGDGFAIISTSLLFGLMHGNFVQIPFAFVLGIILAFLTVYTKSILPAMLLHFCNNTFAVVLEIINDIIDNDQILVTIEICIFLISIVVGLISFYYFTKKNKNMAKIEKSTSMLTLKEKLSSSFTSAAAILTILIYLAQAFIMAFAPAEIFS